MFGIRKLYAVYALLSILLVALVTYVSLNANFAPPGKVPHLDKFIHFWGYALVSAALMLPFYRRLKYRIFVWVCVLWGSGMIELLQNFVPNRTASWLDFFANALGVLTGGFAGVVCSIIIQKRTDIKPLFWKFVEYLRGL